MRTLMTLLLACGATIAAASNDPAHAQFYKGKTLTLRPAVVDDAPVVPVVAGTGAVVVIVPEGFD